MASRRSRRAEHAGQLSFTSWAEGMVKRAEAHDLHGQALGLFSCVLGLILLGLLVQVSFVSSLAPPAEFRQATLVHLLFRLGAVLALIVGYTLGPRGVRPLIPVLLVGAGLLLVGCFLPGIGVERNGSHRWVDVGVVFQPSELARIACLLWIADRCVRLGPAVDDLKRGALPMLAVGMAFFLLILAETDLGGAMLLLICVVSTMWVGGARPLHMTLSAVAIGGGAITTASVAIPYVRQRVAMWFGSVQNEQVEGTLQALASGGLFGTGLTQGTARLSRIPYLESDYVFAQIGEELGLIGMFAVLGLLVAFSWYALRLVLSIRDRYAALVAFSLLLSVVLQAMVHVQVGAALAPPKGMTLPFISDGGTSLIVSSLAVGLALGASRHGGSVSSQCSPSNATA